MVSSEREIFNLIARVLLIALGAALLLFGIADLLIPRARFVSSSPQPGSTIAAPPTTVVVRFSNELSPESEIDVVSTVRLLPSGEQDYADGKTVVISSRLDPDDPSRRSMLADLRPGLHHGLYFIKWRTKSAGWRAITYGKTAFGAGTAVPEHITRDMDGSIWERTYQQRSRRGALVGGVVMIALGWFINAFKRG